MTQIYINNGPGMDSESAAYLFGSLLGIAIIGPIFFTPIYLMWQFATLQGFKAPINLLATAGGAAAIIGVIVAILLGLDAWFDAWRFRRPLLSIIPLTLGAMISAIYVGACYAHAVSYFWHADENWTWGVALLSGVIVASTVVGFAINDKPTTNKS